MNAAAPSNSRADRARQFATRSFELAAEGDPTGALDSADEASTHFRVLAAADPQTHLSELAASLNNLANRRAEAGNLFGALTVIDEAVAIQRRLFASNPAEFQLDLALSLVSLGNVLAAVGRPEGLDAIGEAVGHYRLLAGADPAFRPGLATALTSLFEHRTMAGDGPGARDALNERVALYRQLAVADPAAFVPQLIGSLLALTDDLLGRVAPDVAVAAWHDAISQQGAALYRGHLRAAFAACAAEFGRTDLAEAAITAATEEVCREPEGLDPAAVSRARQAVRDVARGVAPAHADLPAWVTVTVPQWDLDLVDAFETAAGPAERDAALADYGPLTGGTLAQSVSTLSFLFPGLPALAALTAVLEASADMPAEPVMEPRPEPAGTAQPAAPRRPTAVRPDMPEPARLVIGWLETANWSESFEYLEKRQQKLRTPAVVQTLMSLDNEVGRQHLGILALLEDLPIVEVFHVVVNPAIAAETALAAVREGELARAMVTLDACPQVTEVPGTGPFLHAVVALLLEDVAEAHKAAALAARSATAAQNREQITLLRSLANAEPDPRWHAAIGDLVEVLRSGPFAD